MDWGVFLSSFGLIFLAELGDKTQLSMMLLSAKSDAPAAVFIGGALALVASAFLGVLFGEAITRVLSPQYVRLGAGFAFIGIGALLVTGRL